MKIRLTRTMVTEYEPQVDYYPDGFTIEQMAQMDSEADDLESVFMVCESDAVKWEIID